MAFSLVLHSCMALALLFGGLSFRPDAAELVPLMLELVTGPGGTADGMPGVESDRRAFRAAAATRNGATPGQSSLAPAAPVPETGAGPKEAVVQPVEVSGAPAEDGRYTVQGPAKGRTGGTGTPGTEHAFGLGGDAAIPHYAENAPPGYPSRARRDGMEGTVILSVEVLPDGTAGNLKVKQSSGHSLLDDAAVEAVKAWRFQPATRQSRPVTSRVEIPVRFFLRKSPPLF
jgi:protein TonB